MTWIFPNGKIFLVSIQNLLDFTVREWYYYFMEILTVKDLSKLIREKRLKLGMTQADASALCNVGTRFLSELENGKPTLQIDKVLKVANFFDIKIFAE